MCTSVSTQKRFGPPRQIIRALEQRTEIHYHYLQDYFHDRKNHLGKIGVCEMSVRQVRVAQVHVMAVGIAERCPQEIAP